MASHLDRILGRLDDLDSTNLTVLVQRLARERSLLETVFNTIQEGVLVIQETGIIEYSNAAANKLIGLKDEDVGRTTLWKLVPELTRTLKVGADTLQIEANVVSRELEISYPEHRYVRFYMVPFSDSRDIRSEQLYAVILSDITEDKITVEERIENERTSSIHLLAASVAHELGNPLNAINIHLQLMNRQISKLADERQAEKLQKSVDVCASEIERLDSIIKNFLQAIRPSEPDLSELNLLELIESVLAVQATELENLNIEVSVILSDDLPIVLGDSNQIKQVLFNLTKNAMEAMDAGGSLTIRTRADDDYVFIHFADTGVGMSEEQLAKVFQPYFSTKETGHGLGMMIVQRILREHGAQIGIDSTEGTGTVVTLQFPQKHRRTRMLESDVAQK